MGMFRCLSPGAVGIKGLSLKELMELAKAAGFEGIDIPAREVMETVAATSASEVVDSFSRIGLRPGGWSVGDWRSEDGFAALLPALPELARAAGAIGSDRVTTWIMSSSELPYDRAWQWHIDRLRPIAQILGDAGCRLGLEYVGPHHLRNRFPHEFLHTSREALRLAADIGTGNVGLLFDAYHWYTAGETVETIKGFQRSDIVSVHVNDAPKDVPVEEQQDGVRCLAGATGVIDIAGFLGGLVQLDYDGPVVVEPFSGAPKGPDPLGIAKATNRSLLDIWKTAGL